MNSATHRVRYILTAILLIIFFVLIYVINSKPVNLPKVGAAGGNAVSGYAWSENIGWISFSNTTDGSAKQYGVNIDPITGNFSGYAWSDNIGWINFAPLGFAPTIPDTDIANHHGGKLEGNMITGWARACAGTTNGDCTGSSRIDGWDGWIKLSGTSVLSTYGVLINPTTGNFSGYAWGSDVVGWINFSPTGTINDVHITVDTTNQGTEEPVTCNHNNKCDAGETLLNCPQDCKGKVEQF